MYTRYIKGSYGKVDSVDWGVTYQNNLLLKSKCEYQAFDWWHFSEVSMFCFFPQLCH